MQISPISTTCNNTSFKEVNMKHYNRLKKSFERYGWFGDELNRLYYKVCYREVSVRDGIDTLKAVEPFVAEGDQYSYNYKLKLFKGMLSRGMN